MELSENSFNRLSLGIIEKNECSPEEALTQLATFKLQLQCGEAIRTSVPLQAAFLTAVNTAKRAFLGGVSVLMPANIVSLLPWPGQLTLNEIAVQLGAETVAVLAEKRLTLRFGLPGDGLDKVEVWASDWQGGVLVNGEDVPAPATGLLPLGGIYAGGLAVALGFQKISEIHPQALDKATGLSLWRPDLPWRQENTEGPKEVSLPSGLWLLGLGHLGQSFLWAIGMLPYDDTSKVNIYLQDFDKMVEANMSAGLLCRDEDENRYKTRICSDWLENRGISTRLLERKFDQHIKCEEGEPSIALCGFDNAYSRAILEKAGFDFIVEAALGDSVDDFDKIMMHIFPSGYHTAENEWANMPKVSSPKKRILNAIKDDEKECGILEFTIAGKAVSASFVGACTGATVIAELIKGLNHGLRTDLIVTQLRYPGDIKSVGNNNWYDVELGLTQNQRSRKVA
jgi:hypothetical protein